MALPQEPPLLSIAHSPTFPSLHIRRQLILQPFHRFTYVTAHSPTVPLLHLRHSSFSNPSFASPTSQALHLIHLASHPWELRPYLKYELDFRNLKSTGLSGAIPRNPRVHWRTRYQKNR